MTSILHAALAGAAWALLWRGLERSAFVAHAPEPQVAQAFALAVLIASGVGSIAAVVAGWPRSPTREPRGWSPSRALALDAISFAAAAWAFAALSLGPWPRELGGVFAVAIVAVRLAPGALAVVSGRAPAWLALVVALGGYAALAAWLPVASLPFGDQIHYLLAADRLAHGDVAFTIDERLFTQLLGIPPSASDAATHVALTPLGPRPVQGYALSLLVLPGWMVAGRLGAGMIIALAAAWTSYQMLLILRDVAEAMPALRGRRQVVGWTWLVASACAPLSLLATHIYPNMIGAAIVATAFRLGFTAPLRRPALAAAILALTLLLTPRDAVALIVLLPFLLRDPARRRAVALGAGAVLAVAAISNALLYGLPIPYAGYAFGTLQAQELTREGSITAFVWVTLPAILFDRTFGIAAVAPWALIGLIGLVPALAADRERVRSVPAARPVLLPAALAVGGSVLALAFFRLWEGGYAPPARYFVDVLPLWAPFVAYGLASLAQHALKAPQAAQAPEAVSGATEGPAGATAGLWWLVRAFVGVAVGLSALTALVLNAVPALALNTAFDDQIRDALGRVFGLDPLGWLPSFQPVTPDWYVAAYVRLVPALAIAGGLLVFAARGVTLGRMGPHLDQTGPRSGERGELRGGGPSGGVGVIRHQIDAEPRRGQREIALFSALNLLGIAVVLLATSQPWVAAGTDPVPDSLYRKWLPISLALATFGAIVVARAIPSERRDPFLARHLLLYLVPLALMLVGRFGGAVVDGLLGAIYLLIAVGFAANALAALWPAIDDLSDGAAALQLLTVAVVAALVLLPYHRAVMPTASDEPHYLIVTQSLVLDHDLDLANDYAGERYRAFYPSRLPDVHGVQVGAATFSVRDLGLPILAVVPFAVAGRLGVLALLCVVGAALAAQLYLLARDLGFARRVAFLAAATTALAHPILTYTTQVYPELLTALVFVTAVRVLRAGTRMPLRDLATASALLGTLPWLSTRAWPIVVGVGLVVAYAALRPAGGRARELAPRAAAAGLPFAAFVLALAFLNWRAFGLFLPSAGYFLIREQQPVLTFTPWIGVPGLLFDRVFGLVPRAPIYLLAFLGAVPLWRRARDGRGIELAALALGSLLSFAYIADIAYWWADGSPPSRYLLGSLPLFVAAVAGGWEVVLGDAVPEAWRAPAHLAARLSVVASAVVTYIYAVLPNIRYDLALDIAATASSGAFFGFLSRVSGADVGGVFPSLVRPDALGVVLTIAWVLIAGILVAVPERTR